MEHKCKFDVVASALFLALSGLVMVSIGCLADNSNTLRDGLTMIFVALTLVIGHISARL